MPLIRIATYLVPFEDFDYRPMVEACGLELLAFVVRPNHPAGHVLTVRGDNDAVNAFSADLSWGPAEFEPVMMH